jgi:hypothetical protein
MRWDEYPDAVGYDVRTLTGEGASARLARQPHRCLRIEVAAGENTAAELPARRKMLLAMQQGQLAFQVRAVGRGGRVSPWSRPLAVGAEA